MLHQKNQNVRLFLESFDYSSLKVAPYHNLEGELEQIRYPINPNVINKDKNFHSLATDIVVKTGTILDYAKDLCKGYATYASIWKNHRKAENFVETWFLLIDIDNNEILKDEFGEEVKDAEGKKVSVLSSNPYTIEDAIKDPFVRKYCSFGYTTPSHKTEHPKFRLVFRLPSVITDASEHKAIVKYLGSNFPADSAPTSTVSSFYGNSNAIPFIFNSSAVLPEEWLTEALEVKALEDAKAAKSQQLYEAARAEFEKNLSEGESIEALILDALSSIPPRRPGSGTYDESRNIIFALVKELGHIKAKSVASRWSPSFDGWDVDKLVDAAGKYAHIDPGLSYILKVAKSYGYKVPPKFKQMLSAAKKEQVKAELKAQYLNNPSDPVVYSDSEFVPSIGLPKKLTVIDYPKDGRKTTSLKDDIIPNAQKDWQSKELEGQERVIGVAPTRTLAKQLADNLGLEYIGDLVKKSEGYNIPLDKVQYLSVVWNSLHKAVPFEIDPEQPILLILDEITKGLTHGFGSRTLTKDSARHADVISTLKQLLRHIAVNPNSYVVGTQHRIPEWVVTFLKSELQLVGLEGEELAKKFLFLKRSSQKAIKHKKINWIAKSDEVSAVLDQFVSEGQTMFVAHDSKKWANEEELRLKEKFGDKVRVLNINSDTVDEVQQELFLQDSYNYMESLKESSDGAIVVLASPTMVTGYSIDVDPRINRLNKHFDVVVGNFTGTLSPDDIDQILHRVRYVEDIYLCCKEVATHDGLPTFELQRDSYLSGINGNLKGTGEAGYLYDDETEGMVEVKTYEQILSIFIRTEPAIKNALWNSKAHDSALRMHCKEVLKEWFSEAGYEQCDVSFEVSEDLKLERETASEQVSYNSFKEFSNLPSMELDKAKEIISNKGDYHQDQVKGAFKRLDVENYPSLDNPSNYWGSYEWVKDYWLDEKRSETLRALQLHFKVLHPEYVHKQNAATFQKSKSKRGNIFHLSAPSKDLAKVTLIQESGVMEHLEDVFSHESEFVIKAYEYAVSKASDFKLNLGIQVRTPEQIRQEALRKAEKEGKEVSEEEILKKQEGHRLKVYKSILKQMGFKFTDFTHEEGKARRHKIKPTNEELRQDVFNHLSSRLCEIPTPEKPMRASEIRFEEPEIITLEDWDIKDDTTETLTYPATLAEKKFYNSDEYRNLQLEEYNPEVYECAEAYVSSCSADEVEQVTNTFDFNTSRVALGVMSPLTLDRISQLQPSITSSVLPVESKKPTSEPSTSEPMTYKTKSGYEFPSFSELSLDNQKIVLDCHLAVVQAETPEALKLVGKTYDREIKQIVWKELLKPSERMKADKLALAA